MDPIRGSGRPSDRAKRATALRIAYVLVVVACGSPEIEDGNVPKTAAHASDGVGARGAEDVAVGDTVIIGDSAACATCSIELIKVATIGAQDIPGALTDQAAIWRAHDGRFYVRDVTIAPGQILVYDSAGRYMTAFGRKGEAPGEYTAAWGLIPRSEDTLQIQDGSLHRVTTVTAGGYAVVRTDRLPLAFGEYAVLDDGGIVVHGMLRTREAMGYPLHHLGPDYQVMASFGTDDPAYDPTDRSHPYRFARQLASAGGDRVWAARRNRFVIELWNASGTRLRTYQRKPGWFHPWDTNWAPWQAPPRPTLESVRQDEHGLLWVMLWTPDPQWRPVEPIASTTLAGHERRPRSAYNVWYDTMIEIWAPDAGQLIASHLSDLRLRGFLHGGYMYSVHEDPLGNAYFDVWRPQLTGYQGGE